MRMPRTKYGGVIRIYDPPRLIVFLEFSDLRGEIVFDGVAVYC